MNAQTFFRELKRRNVYKVAVAYAVIAWLLIETTSVLLFGHEERTSVVTALTIILALALCPGALYFLDVRSDSARNETDRERPG
jgi:hypothetical protein